LILVKELADYWEEVERTGELTSRLSLKYGIVISSVRDRETDWLMGDSPFSIESGGRASQYEAENPTTAGR